VCHKIRQADKLVFNRLTEALPSPPSRVSDWKTELSLPRDKAAWWELTVAEVYSSQKAHFEANYSAWDRPTMLKEYGSILYISTLPNCVDCSTRS
jgi:hypothetical protein